MGKHACMDSHLTNEQFEFVLDQIKNMNQEQMRYLRKQLSNQHDVGEILSRAEIDTIASLF